MSIASSHVHLLPRDCQGKEDDELEDNENVIVLEEGHSRRVVSQVEEEYDEQPVRSLGRT